MLLLQQMLVLFIYMILGYWAAKKNFLDDVASSKISWIVVNISNPAMILSSAVNGEGAIQGKELLTTFILAIVMFVILLVLAEVLPRLVRVSDNDRGIYKNMTVFNNIAFMGFPIIAATYGNNALLYAAVFMIPFNVLLYSYGIQTLQEKSDNSKGFQIKKIFNVGVIACLISAVLYLAQIPVPQVVKSASQGLSNLSGPLSMIVIGISLAGMKIKELFLDRRLLVFTFLKLLVIPVIGTALIVQVIDNPLLCEVCMIMLATPVASMSVMLAKQYGADSDLAAKGVALTTLLSVATIPIVSAIVF